MAFREVTMLEIKEVLRLWLKGIPKKRIAAERGLDVKTVRRYMKAAERCGMRLDGGEAALDEARVLAVMERLQPAARRPRGDGWARCAEQKAFIKGHLDHSVRLSKIRKLLRRNGVLVSDATLRRFAALELGCGGAALSIPVADCGPGKEIQLDTGWMAQLSVDHEPRIHLVEELEEALGAGRSERREARRGYRHGTRERTLHELGADEFRHAAGAGAGRVG